MQAQLGEDYAQLLKQLPQLRSTVEEEIDATTRSAERQLFVDDPYYEHEEVLEGLESHFERTVEHKSAAGKAFEKYDGFLRLAQIGESNYWEKAISKLKNNADPEARLTHQHILQTWRKQLAEKRTEWQLETLNRIREELYRKLNEWLEYIKTLTETVNSLGLEPGVFIDFSEGQPYPQDMEMVKEWADYISKDEGVRQLCELMGKLRQISLSEEIEVVERTQSYERTEIDVDSSEEIIGIRLGKDLAHVLPSELALLSAPDTSILFDLKYAENRLMCFDLIGMHTVMDEETIKEEQSINKEDEKGPIMICVDTSGSMHGTPETIAKALTMYLALEAKKDKRKCYLINFSTGIDTLDLSDNYPLKTLLEFLRMSFNGGTDVAPALNHGIEMMQTDDYENADLLVISDCVMGNLPQATTAEIEKLKEEGNRFYSLCIGNDFMAERLKRAFDREWVYDPSSSGIKELYNREKELAENMHTAPEERVYAG